MPEFNDVGKLEQDIGKKENRNYGGRTALLKKKFKLKPIFKIIKCHKEEVKDLIEYYKERDV